MEYFHMSTYGNKDCLTFSFRKIIPLTFFGRKENFISTFLSQRKVTKEKAARAHAKINFRIAR